MSREKIMDFFKKHGWWAILILVIGYILATEWGPIARTMWQQIVGFSPNADFLSDVAAFEAAVISFAIPLSIDMISRISDRYQSSVMSRRFEGEKINRLFPIALLVTISLAIILRFRVGDEAASMAWKIVAWIFLLISLATACWIYKFIQLLRSYASNESFLVKKLLDDAKSSIQ